MEEKKRNYGLAVFFIAIIVVLIIALVVVSWGSLKNSKKNNINTLGVEEATLIVRDVYDRAYSEVQEGFGLTNGDKNIIVNGENIEATEWDVSKIEPYFTERAINYIKSEYTDTPRGFSDGKYYLFTENDRKDFLRTIFGVTDQGERNFNVKLCDDNMILAVSEKSSYFKLDEYIILKKVDNTWKIDMFEEL